MDHRPRGLNQRLCARCRANCERTYHGHAFAAPNSEPLCSKGTQMSVNAPWDNPQTIHISINAPWDGLQAVPVNISVNES